MNKHQIHPKREFESIRHIVESAAEEYGDRVAFSYKVKPSAKEKVRVSYTEFRDDVRGLATEMLARGMKGKHVVVVGKMSYDFIVTYYASLLIGAVLVPLDRDWASSPCAPRKTTAGSKAQTETISSLFAAISVSINK